MAETESGSDLSPASDPPKSPTGPTPPPIIEFSEDPSGARPGSGRARSGDDPWAVVKVHPPTIRVEAGEIKVALAKEQERVAAAARVPSPPPLPPPPDEIRPMADHGLRDAPSPKQESPISEAELFPMAESRPLAPPPESSPPSLPPPPARYAGVAGVSPRREAGAGGRKAPDVSLPDWQGWLALLLVVSMPLVAHGQPSEWLARWFSGGRIPNVTWFDLGVWSLAAVWAVSAAWRGRLGAALDGWLRCVWPALPLLAAAAVSLTALDPDDAEGWREAGIRALQWVEYFLIAPWVLLPALRSERWRKRAMAALLLTMAYVLIDLLASTPLTGFYDGGRHPFHAGGWLANRQLYTLFAGVTACLASGWLALRLGAFRWDLAGILLLWTPAAALLTPALSGWLLAGALLGLGAAWSGIRRGGAALLFPLLAWLLWAGPAAVGAASVSGAISEIFRLETPPRALRHREILLDSLQTWREGDGRSGHRPLASPRMLRWSAELSMAADRPWFGSGLGQVQRRVDSYYASLPRARAATDIDAEYERRIHEPSTFSWYHQTAAEMGLLGLAALAMFLGELFGRASRLGRSRRMPAAGLLGALIVLAWGGLWTVPLARGAGALVGLLLAFSGLDETDEEKPARDR